MTPWVVLNGTVSEEEVVLLEKVKKLIDAFPERLDLSVRGKTFHLSCHLICRAIGSVFGLAVRDGYFGRRGFEHSWLITKQGNILDPCIIGQVGGPMIVIVGRYSPWTELYMEHDLRIANLFEPAFLEHEKLVTKVMFRLAEILNILPRAA